MTVNQQNYAGNITFNAARFHQPATMTDLRKIVRKADKLRVVGARHCFNDIADTSGDLLSLHNLDNKVVIDDKCRTATFSAGLTYRELCPILHAAGYALHNMASLAHITVIGACMSATHGSGDTLGNLATAVSGLEIVTANGDLITLTRDRDSEQFSGAVVALGALGVVTKVTLDLLPAFSIRQHVYRKVPMARIADSFDAIMAAGYSVSLFPTWQRDEIDSLLIKQRIAAEDRALAPVPTTLFDAPLDPGAHLFASTPREYINPMDTPGPWHERLPHFSDDAQLTGDELQSEYFVARPHAVAALQAVALLREELAPILRVSEIRSVAKDELWLSPAYGQDVVGIHFTWRKDWPGVKRFLPVLEAQLAPFAPRPHWGKLFVMEPAQVRAAYPRMVDFQALVRQFDPEGKFCNAYIDRYIFGAAQAPA